MCVCGVFFFACSLALFDGILRSGAYNYMGVVQSHNVINFVTKLIGFEIELTSR